MVAHDFIVKNREGELKYKLFFDKHHPGTITLPAPCLIYLKVRISFHGRPFKPTGTLHQPLSRNHNLSLHDSLITFGIRRWLPASGSQSPLHLITTPATPTGIRQALAMNQLRPKA